MHLSFCDLGNLTVGRQFYSIFNDLGISSSRELSSLFYYALHVDTTTTTRAITSHTTTTTTTTQQQQHNDNNNKQKQQQQRLRQQQQQLSNFNKTKLHVFGLGELYCGNRVLQKVTVAL